MCGSPSMSNARMTLSRSQSLRVAAVLEDFQNQLDLLAKAFAVDLDMNPHSPHEKITLNKLIQDCHTISEHVRTFRVELEERQTFSSLLQKIEEEERRKQREAEYLRRVTKADFREKQEFLIKQQEELANKQATLKKLMQEWKLLEDKRHEHRERAKIMKRDKEDKLLLLQQEAKEKETLLEQQIMVVKERMKNEQRSHKESIKFLQNQKEEMKQLRETWEERTRVMRQDKVKKLNNVRCKITLNLDKLMDMKRRFRIMEQVVMEDMEEQEKLLQEQKLVQSATKIQAWWRGSMVRKGIGIPKKTEEDKKGTKKEKKKDGKKKKK